MTSKAIQDFLTKQILIDKNIVTYRSLSRQQSLHVNDAKNELSAFLEQMHSQQEKVAATYLVSGEAQERETLDENAMDVDEEYDDDGAEDVPETRIILVGEEDLPGVKTQFISIDAIYVYALSPSPIHDVDLLCGPMDIVRHFDAQGGSKLAEMVGKVVTEGIQDVKIKPKGKAPEAPLAKPVTASSEKEAKEKVETAKLAKQDSVKPKPTGKIDFSKAKSKSEKEKEKATEETKKKAGEVKVKKEETLKHFESKKLERNEKGSIKKMTPPNTEKQKTSSGTKGKGPEKPVNKKTKAMLSDSEDDSASAATNEKQASARTGSESAKLVKAKDTPSESGEESSSARLRINKRTIVSDDEESEAPVAKKKILTKSRKAIKAALAESDDDLKAMMDVDDEEVIRASRPSIGASKAGQDEEEDTAEAKQEGETDMDDGVAPLPKKTRKPKKVVPVGRNGLKKRQVMKSRMSTDAKGYMVTEDYSSYESVDEEELQTPPAPTKGKKSGKAKKEVEEEEVASTSKSVAKPLVKSSSIPGKARGDAEKASQKNISHFFGSKGK